MKTFLLNNKISYKEKIDIKKLTGISGGTCDYFCEPDNEEKVKNLLKHCINNTLKYEIVGGISNTYFTSKYNPNVIISTKKINSISESDSYIECGAGYNLTKLSRYCVQKGYAGYQDFIGIPGTIGGAVINNAGAFNSEVSDKTISITLIDEKGIKHTIKKDKLNFKRRYSSLKDGTIKGMLLNVKLDITQKADPQELRKITEKQTKYRKEFIDGKRKSLGSIFIGSTIHEIYKKNKLKILFKNIIYLPFKLTVKNPILLKKINKNLTFLFLGIFKSAKHCDDIGRFCWDDNTKEYDFYRYLKAISKLSKGNSLVEISIKK